MNSKRPRRESELSDASDRLRAGYAKDGRAPRSALLDPIPSITSPQSDSSGSSHNLSNATSRWFGLLASDVSSANHSFASPLLSTRQLSDTPARTTVSPKTHTSAYSTIDKPYESRPPVTFGRSIAAARVSTGEPRMWSPSPVPETEYILMRHFVKDVSTWLDLNDPHRHFSVLVPHLAMRDQGLMKAILALSARDLTIKPKERSPDFQPDRNIAVEYYHETLQYLQQAMKDETFLRSDELLCTILLLSTYELIDGDAAAWERHLKGAFGVQRSLEISGESGGLKQAVWWAWLRQDLWAAFREHRKIFSVFVPTKPYETMTIWDLAERAVYLCCQAVNFASTEEVEAGKKNVPMRIQQGQDLMRQLDTWLRYLPPHFQQLAMSEKRPDSPFNPIWIHPQSFGTCIVANTIFQH